MQRFIRAHIRFQLTNLHKHDDHAVKLLDKCHSLPIAGFGSASKFLFCQYLWHSWDHGFVVFSTFTCQL